MLICAGFGKNEVWILNSSGWSRKREEEEDVGISKPCFMFLLNDCSRKRKQACICWEKSAAACSYIYRKFLPFWTPRSTGANWHHCKSTRHLKILWYVAQSVNTCVSAAYSTSNDGMLTWKVFRPEKKQTKISNVFTLGGFVCVRSCASWPDRPALQYPPHTMSNANAGRVDSFLPENSSDLGPPRMWWREQ